MIAAEAKAMNPGGETAITRLADILVVHAIPGEVYILTFDLSLLRRNGRIRFCELAEQLNTRCMALSPRTIASAEKNTASAE